MIKYRISETENELDGIIVLQKANLISALTTDEISSQGFVTVVHSPEDLTKLNNIERHVIAIDYDQVVAYLLTMTSASRNDIPILIPMFDVFDKTPYRGKLIADHTYMVVGQVCVDKAYRGQGILDQCYQEYRQQYKTKYDFAITEIDVRNTRSIRAHERIGFKEIIQYHANGIQWSIVLWDWK